MLSQQSESPNATPRGSEIDREELESCRNFDARCLSSK